MVTVKHLSMLLKKLEWHAVERDLKLQFLDPPLCPDPYQHLMSFSLAYFVCYVNQGTCSLDVLTEHYHLLLRYQQPLYSPLHFIGWNTGGVT